MSQSHLFQSNGSKSSSEMLMLCQHGFSFVTCSTKEHHATCSRGDWFVPLVLLTTFTVYNGLHILQSEVEGFLL